MTTADFSLRKMIEAAPNGRQWLDVLNKAVPHTGPRDVLVRLASLTDDNLVVAPIYPLTGSSERPLSVTTRSDRAWKNLTRIDHPSPSDANAQLLQDLQQGADGAVLVLSKSPSALGFGVEIQDQSDLDALFDNVFLEAVSFRFEGTSDTHFALWKAYCSQRGYSVDSLDVMFSALTPGRHEASHPGLIADAANWHNRGATAAQELGLALAELVYEMRRAKVSGPESAPVTRKMSVTLSCDADQFETMAKFRAMRLLWRNLFAAMDAEAPPLNLHASTSWRMMGRRDPWTNVLRTSMAAFAAGLGGADSVTVLPHTQALGLPDAFARRVARNISLILQEESHLNKVADPAAGAGVYDQLTVALAEKAWTIFQSLEAQGGFMEAIDGGAVRQIIDESRQVRRAQIKSRAIVSLGNSHFAKLDEPEFGTLMERPLEMADKDPGLDNVRDGVVFERLAKRARTLSAHTKPAISLICLGDRKSWKPRADFAADLFAAGGLSTAVHEVESDPALDTFEMVRTPVICLCGTDADYSDSAQDLISKLRDTGGRHILLAGRSDMTGLDDVVFQGCDAPAVLDRLLSVLEGMRS